MALPFPWDVGFAILAMVCMAWTAFLLVVMDRREKWKDKVNERLDALEQRRLSGAFTVGTRVRHASVPGAVGTVLSDDGVNVMVRWEDGRTGWLYREPGMVPNASDLVEVTE